MLVSVNKPCHVPHASPYNFYGKMFWYVQEMSHILVTRFQGTNLKRLAVELLRVCPNSALEIRKRKRKRMTIENHFALHANVITDICSVIYKR